VGSRRGLRASGTGWVMSRVRSEAAYGLYGFLGGFAAVTAFLILSSGPADARHHRYYHLRVVHQPAFARHVVAVRRHAAAESYAPPGSSIVVDGNTGHVLHAANADAPRHPASLTKIMTLYLLFERLEAGRIKLDTPLRVSEHASEQAPTKLGLKSGQTIAVEDAIKAVVTKSANDAAVAIAENLEGDEGDFAKLMTQKAHALGMNRTTYVNASGLPDDDQVTTAQDQALLGRAIQERFPRYYKYFSTEEFVYRGTAMRNHNHLLGAVGGVDGIKTGYTRASGFNLVTSVHRDGRYIIAVVLGGRSAPERDARMRELITDHIKEASLRRTSPAIAEKAEPHVDPQPVAFAKAPLATHTDAAPAAGVSPKANGGTTVGSNDPIQPLLVKTITYRTAPVQTAPITPMPALVAAAPSLPVPQANGAAAMRTPPVAQLPEPPSTIVVASAEPAAIATSAKTEPAKTETAKPEPTKPERAKNDLAKNDLIKNDLAKEQAAPPLHARGGWLIQIGAFEGEDEAKQHLSDAKLKVPTMLGAADPFTERVQKGDKALFRARFAGFDKITAEAACRQLKRSDIACMTVKN
jgi:D-alanyl-D-alanine carboxypeptidase